MDNQEQDLRKLMESAYDENGKVKPVTAASLKAIAEMAARAEQMKASQPDLSEKDKSGSFMIGPDFFKDTLRDDSNPKAVILRNLTIFVMKKIGMLDEFTHDGLLEDKVYELAAVFELGKFPERQIDTNDPSMNLVKFVETLRAQEK